MLARVILVLPLVATPTLACNADEELPETKLPQEPQDSDSFGTFAREGIELTGVTIDQGVSIALFAETLEIEPDQRNTDVVAGRPALFRAFWVVPDDWEPREITARLQLHYADGTTERALKTIEIEDDSVPHWFDGAYAFYVPGELIKPGMDWDLALYESDADGPPEGSLPPAVVPRAPFEGSLTLGVDEAPREIELVVVPIDHQFDGGKDCPDEPPVFDDARLQGFADALYSHNPVRAATVRVREEPLVWDETATNLSKILDELGKIRAMDDADPWVYYYGAIEPCDWGSEAGFAGLAYVPRETDPSEAWRRVAIGDIAVSESSTIETFVHEVGHNQERRHVPCGGPKGAVEDYPYRDGKVANFGFDVLTWRLHLPTERDYMSYCGPSWPSDYGWNQVLPVLAELTSWKTEGISAPTGPGMVIGAMYPDGTEAWWTLPGDPHIDETSADEMAFIVDGEPSSSAPMSVTVREDGSVEMVAALPADFDHVTQLRPMSTRAHAAVPRAELRLLHDRATR